MNRREMEQQIRALWEKVASLNGMVEDMYFGQRKYQDAPHGPPPLELVKRGLRHALCGDMESEDRSIRITHIERYMGTSGAMIRVSIEMKEEK